MNPVFSRRIVALGILFLGGLAQAFDYGNAIKGALEKHKGTVTTTQPASNATSGTSSAGVANLTSSEINTGLKEALSRGAEAAVAQLGQKDGFFGNAAMKIPLPPMLQKGEKLMRAAGMGQQADDLVLSMNRAAEAAVPEAKTLLVSAVKNMTLQDAKGILTGGATSATDFFRNKTEASLTQRFLPIVKATTDKSGLAQKYNSYAGMASKFGINKNGSATVEDYVTRQSLDRLYKLVGEQERTIRANPLQAGSDLLKKVFSAVAK